MQAENERLRACVDLLRPEEADRFWHMYRTHPHRLADEAKHTQECDDHAFVHHVATGGDAECICRAPSPPADEAKP